MVRVMEGPLFSEVASYYQHVQTVVRLYNVPGEILRLCQVSLAQGTGPCCPWSSASHCLPAGVEGLSLDVSCLVDIRDHINKELALRFSTDIESDDTFFTDLNGFQVCSRLGRGSSCPQGDSALAPGTVGSTCGHWSVSLGRSSPAGTSGSCRCRPTSTQCLPWPTSRTCRAA